MFSCDLCWHRLFRLPFGYCATGCVRGLELVLGSGTLTGSQHYWNQECSLLALSK